MRKTSILLLVVVHLLAFSLKAQVPTNGLVAWYPLNGNTLDSSGNGNNGLNNGALPAFDRFNKFSAYSFDGSTNYIQINLNSINNTVPANTGFTSVAWIKTSVPNGPIVSLRICS